VGRTPIRSEQFSAKLRDEVAGSTDARNFTESGWREFQNRLHYYGEVNAHSRVQMALGEAKAKTKAEFETVLKSTGKSLDEIREFVADHRELRRPFYHVPHHEGIASTAAQFVLHVNDLINSRASKRKRSTAWMADPKLA
jgi:hypothetical protein